jgi:hypothetical protein
MREKEVRESLAHAHRIWLVNELFLRAVENAPLPVLPPETLTKGRQLQLIRKNPEAAQKLTDIRAAQNSLRTAVVSMKRRAMDHAGLEPRTVAPGGETAE